MRDFVSRSLSGELHFNGDFTRGTAARISQHEELLESRLIIAPVVEIFPITSDFPFAQVMKKNIVFLLSFFLLRNAHLQWRMCSPEGKSLRGNLKIYLSQIWEKAHHYASERKNFLFAKNIVKLCSRKRFDSNGEQIVKCLRFDSDSYTNDSCLNITFLIEILNPLRFRLHLNVFA